MIFEFDQWPRPNLAKHQAQPLTPAWREFSQHWPFSEPPMLVEYCQSEGIPTNQGIRCYLVALSFFDFSIDWFSLIPAERIDALRQQQLYLMFFYSEGDNPRAVRDHLEQQCVRAGVPVKQLLLVTANSISDQLPGSAWFADDELLYRHRNQNISALPYHEQPRSRLFTALVRTHKWWRATVMTEFWRRGWHELGYFSYNPAVTIDDSEENNPIEIEYFPGLQEDIHKFLQTQFTADDMNSDQHNDHTLIVPAHYDDSYINVIIETHMDTDQSGGVFLTEKTFKPIKHCQPFIVFGAPHTLKKLRELGYRTFDNVIDNSYDNIVNTTDRWWCATNALRKLIEQGNEGLRQTYCQCRNDLVHNQQLFLSSKRQRIESLLGKINCKL